MMLKSMSESAIRSRANTRGYRVWKSRQRSTHYNNEGEFMLVNENNCVVLGERFNASLEDIAAYLAELDRGDDVAA
jgi:hypothetical protein